MTTFLIIGVYLLGILTTWCFAAHRIGLNLANWAEQSLAAARAEWFSEANVQQFKNSWFYQQMMRALSLWFVIGALWPVALPLTAMLMRGTKVAETRADIKRRMKAAEAEIERIRTQEGWKTT